MLPSRPANTRRLPPHLTQANTSKSNVLLSNSALFSRGVLCFIPSVRAAASFPSLASSSPAGGNSFNVREWLNEGRVDIGLFYGGPGASHAFATPVMSEQLMLIGAGDDGGLSAPRYTLEEALRFPLMVPGRPHGNRLQIEWLVESHGFELKVAMEVDSLPRVLRAVAIEPAFTRTLLLGRSARRMTSSRAEKLVPLLTEVIAEHYKGVDQYGRRAPGSGADG